MRSDPSKIGHHRRRPLLAEDDTMSHNVTARALPAPVLLNPPIRSVAEPRSACIFGICLQIQAPGEVSDPRNQSHSSCVFTN
jgi:hypothetical protein